MLAVEVDDTRSKETQWSKDDLVEQLNRRLEERLAWSTDVEMIQIERDVAL